MRGKSYINPRFEFLLSRSRSKAPIVKSPSGKVGRGRSKSRERSASRCSENNQNFADCGGAGGGGSGRGRSSSRPRKTKCTRARSKSITKEQRVLQEVIELNPMDIINTQNYVYTTFSKGESILNVMYELFIKNMGTLAIPNIRVARRSMQEPFHSVDNRRLFVFKVLGLTSIPCTEINWTKEFDNKLAQHSTVEDNDDRVHTTHDIQYFRGRFIDHLKIKADNRGNMLYVPRNAVGFIVGSQFRTYKRMQIQYGVKITVPHYKYQEETFEVVPIIVEATESVSKGKGKGKKGGIKNIRDGTVRIQMAIRNMKKMTNKVCARNGQTEFFTQI